MEHKLLFSAHFKFKDNKTARQGRLK
uniref:Uncharacterized protein n=1 Tax=Rhizophora mucronata TaxID=61149 RepID=A0A2P2QSG4_RHIMU